MAGRNGNGITLTRQTMWFLIGAVGTGAPVVYKHGLSGAASAGNMLPRVTLRDTIGAANQATVIFDATTITITATLNAVFDATLQAVE